MTVKPNSAFFISRCFLIRLFHERVRLSKCSITRSVACSSVKCFNGMTARSSSRTLATERAGRSSVWAYLLVGGGHYVWEEAIESLVNPRQSEMKPMIEPHVAPAHTHPFEALLNQPLTGTFH